MLHFPEGGVVWNLPYSSPPKSGVGLSRTPSHIPKENTFYVSSSASSRGKHFSGVLKVCKCIRTRRETPYLSRWTTVMSRRSYFTRTRCYTSHDAQYFCYFFSPDFIGLSRLQSYILHSSHSSTCFSAFLGSYHKLQSESGDHKTLIWRQSCRKSLIYM